MRVALTDGWPLWAVPPVIPPVTTGAPQEYIVFAGTMLPPPFNGLTLYG